MIGDVAVVTDSAAMLPADLVERHGVLVTPLSIILDGQEYLDGVDIGADELYARIESVKQVSTSQPPPGRIVECYRSAAGRGAREVISLHIGSNVSGTVDAARLAARMAPLPVTVVDTGQASFAEGLCVWEAIDALACGLPVPEAAARAEAAGWRTGNTFVVKALGLIRRGGRLRDEGAALSGVPVLALHPDGVRVSGNATSLDEAVDLMAQHVEAAALAAAPGRLRVGIGHGAAPEIASTLRRCVEEMSHVGEIIDYVVGPSMGAHLGPGNAGAVFLARPAGA